KNVRHASSRPKALGQTPVPVAKKTSKIRHTNNFKDGRRLHSVRRKARFVRRVVASWTHRPGHSMTVQDSIANADTVDLREKAERIVVHKVTWHDRNAADS